MSPEEKLDVSYRQNNAVQAAIAATLVAYVFCNIFHGSGSSTNGLVPSTMDATLATAIVTGPIWYFAFPYPTGNLDRAKIVGIVVVFCATCGMFMLNMIGNTKAGEMASATALDLLLLPALSILLAILTCFFMGLLLLPLGAYAAYYLRRYQIDNRPKTVN